MAKKNKVSKGEQIKATVQVKPKAEIREIIEPKKTIKTEKVKEVKTPKNVYHPDYKLIDDTIEDIKKTSRAVCTNDYSTNNVYIFLQDCLKRIILAEK